MLLYISRFGKFCLFIKLQYLWKKHKLCIRRIYPQRFIKHKIQWIHFVILNDTYVISEFRAQLAITLITTFFFYFETIMPQRKQHTEHWRDSIHPSKQCTPEQLFSLSFAIKRRWLMGIRREQYLYSVNKY